jgi:hypothetical protein
MIAALVAVVLVASGLVAGVLLWTAVCGVPLLVMMPPERYVKVHQFWGNRFEPFQPVCVAVTVLFDLILAVIVSTTAARTLFGVGSAAALSIIVISATRNVPIKRWVMSLQADALPEDWAQRDPRRHWQVWNLTRTVLAVLVLVCNAVAVAALL